MAAHPQYEGEYKSGVMDGRGTYRFADGSVYVGDYRNGKREGRGVYRFSDVSACTQGGARRQGSGCCALLPALCDCSAFWFPTLLSS